MRLLPIAATCIAGGLACRIAGGLACTECGRGRRHGSRAVCATADSLACRIAGSLACRIAGGLACTEKSGQQQAARGRPGGLRYSDGLACRIAGSLACRIAGGLACRIAGGLACTEKCRPAAGGTAGRAACASAPEKAKDSVVKVHLVR